MLASTSIKNLNRSDDGIEALLDSRSTTWVIMQFGVPARPTVNATNDLRLALENFFQLLRLIATVKQKSAFKIASEDRDPSLRGLSVFADDKLVLTLQPAASVRTDRERETSLQGLPSSFRGIARMLLVGLSERHELTQVDVERFQNTSVGRSFRLDADRARLDDALGEDAVPSDTTQEERVQHWDMLMGANTRIAVNE